jgi:GNAT superfamily N-acetyltransferase
MRVMGAHRPDDRVDHATQPHPAGAAAVPSVRLLEPGDLSVAAFVLARAFADEPAKHALFGSAGAGRAPFPDANTRTRFAAAVARGRLRAAARYAAVHVADIDGSIVGVAMWYPPGVQPGSLPSAAVAHALLTPGTRVVSLITSVTGALWRDRRTFRRLVAGRSAAAKEAGRGPSWYLAVLGTDPDHRGRGVARRLLDRTLERCDVEGLPAWLETTEEATAGMYERFGFGTVAAIDGGTVLPGLWVMRREPRTTPVASRPAGR